MNLSFHKRVTNPSTKLNQIKWRHATASRLKLLTLHALCKTRLAIGVASICCIGATAGLLETPCGVDRERLITGAPTPWRLVTSLVWFWTFSDVVFHVCCLHCWIFDNGVHVLQHFDFRDEIWNLQRLQHLQHILRANASADQIRSD